MCHSSNCIPFFVLNIITSVFPFLCETWKSVTRPLNVWRVQWMVIYFIVLSSHVVEANSLWSSDAIWRHRSGSTLGKWSLLDGTKPLPEPMLIVRSSGNHLKAISKELPRPSVAKISLKITFIKCHSNHPGVNELKHYFADPWYISIWFN